MLLIECSKVNLSVKLVLDRDRLGYLDKLQKVWQGGCLSFLVGYYLSNFLLLIWI